MPLAGVKSFDVPLPAQEQQQEEAPTGKEDSEAIEEVPDNGLQEDYSRATKSRLLC